MCVVSFCLLLTRTEKNKTKTCQVLEDIVFPYLQSSLTCKGLLIKNNLLGTGHPQKGGVRLCTLAGEGRLR